MICHLSGFAGFSDGLFCLLLKGRLKVVVSFRCGLQFYQMQHLFIVIKST